MIERLSPSLRPALCGINWYKLPVINKWMWFKLVGVKVLQNDNMASKRELEWAKEW